MISCIDKKKTNRILDGLFVGALIGVLAIYLWKLRLGNADVDETFYLTIPYRMVKGDCLIVDEWHVSQLWSFLLYPVMKIYLLVHPGTEGIVLTFRYIFLAFHMLVMCVAYGTLKKNHGILAIAVAVIYGIFVPYDIMALSYNSLGLSLAFLLTVTNLETPKHHWNHVITGFLIAGLVLCNPYTVFLYLIYVVYMLVWRDWKGLIYTHVGIIFLVIPFFITVFTRASLQELLVNFPNVLIDSSHPRKSLSSFLKPVLVFVRDYKNYILAFMAFWVLAFLDKIHRKWWVLVLGLVTMLMVLWFAVYSTSGLGMNGIMLPLTPFGFAVFSLMERKDWRMMYAGLIFPVLYAMCLNMSSNQGMYVIADACAVSSCVAVLLFSCWMKKNWAHDRRFLVVLLLLVVCQMGSEIYVKIHHVFWEGEVSSLNAEITFGPLKGIRTTKEKKEKHELIMQDLYSLETTAEENILFFEMMPCGYLVVDAGFGIYSAWSEAEDGMASEKFMKYYELHPDKEPDIIYVDAVSYDKWGDYNWKQYCLEKGYSMEKGELGNYILRK